MMKKSKFLSRKGHNMKSGLMAASLLSISLALGLNMAILPPAYAADSNESAMADESPDRFVRMRLNKSTVVRLPADARDVIVGNPEVVDAVIRTKNTVYLFARKIGQTNLFFFDAAGQKILELDLEVSMDTIGVRKLINRTLPGNRITVDSVNSNIVLGGVARNGLEAKTAMDLAGEYAKADGGAGTVLNTMTIAGEDQVMLKVKVVEIQRDVLKQFGVDLSALVDVGKFAFKVASVNPFTSGLLSPGAGHKVTSNGSTPFEGLIRAMEGDGLVRTLAEPNLTAMTGQSAKFHAGGEFPFRACSGTGVNQTCSVSFKEFGVQVEFTPTVLSEDRINLKIKTDVSELTTIPNSDIPGTNRRASETVLELPSGGSMMVAGLIKESTRQSINGTPGLKQLPVLGSLFRSRDFISNETELVVIVTPILVRPTAQGQLTGPDKGFAPSSDKNAILFGRLNKIYGGGADAPGGAYHGNVGFIVE